jgi:N-acetyl-gamma-glutamyl-phosphate reductase
VKAAVLGATGYTGLLLCRLLQRHPEVDALLPVSSSRAGELLRDVDPGIAPEAPKLFGGGRLLTLEEAQAQKPEVVFSALPHLESARHCAPFFGTSVVVDLSADFRLRSADAFQAAYGAPPPEPGLLGSAVYGLSEWHRERIRTADLIANPGCYPTATLLPLLPLAAAGLIEGSVHVNAISGISGAGRKVRPEYLFCERAENAGAYAPGRTHRHVAEMEEQLRAAGGAGTILFIPHLAPLRKGMSVTTIVELRAGVGDSRVESAFGEAYGGAAFVGLRGASIPQTSDVRGTNRCDIAWRREGGSLMLFSALDNLMKGASGQAVQNMNLRLGLVETAGLPVDSEI